MRYHSPKDYLDAAQSAETSATELALLAKSDYGFVWVAVAQNPNVTAEILTLLAMTYVRITWFAPGVALAVIANPRTTAEALALLAEKEGFFDQETGIAFCNNPKTPLEAIQKIMVSDKAKTLFRRRTASNAQRQDVLEFLLRDRSEAVRKRAANRLTFLSQNATH